jgi:hypothetical protein
MAIETVRDILIAAGGVTALVGQRISPVTRDQAETTPCVTLELISLVPQNHLAGAPTLDANSVQLDAWATTYAGAQEVADACRVALEAAGLVMVSASGGYDVDADEYRVTQEYSVWT